MTDTAAAPATAFVPRPLHHALLLALPAIGLMTLTLWAFVLATAFSFSVLIDLELVGLAIVLGLLAPPGLWANWHVVRLAVAAERHTA